MLDAAVAISYTSQPAVRDRRGDERRSQDYNALLYAFNQLFDRVDATKPVASRNTSAEIFVTCKGYKAPARIDPRLLDAKHLFKVSHCRESCWCPCLNLDIVVIRLQWPTSGC